jgi:hypothetical protein
MPPGFPDITRRDTRAVDIGPSPELGLCDAWRRFAGTFVFAALDQRPMWMPFPFCTLDGMGVSQKL